MSSRKPSANAKRVAKFKSELSSMDDLFSSESARSKRLSREKEAALRRKSCESKNRYSSKSEAQLAIASCAEHGTKGLSAYRCDYCDGWHLTSHPFSARKELS